MTEELRPYFEAARSVLGGTPIENLDQIRIDSNNAYVESHKQAIGGIIPELACLTATISYENSILQGDNPDKHYGVLTRDPISFRQRMRKLAEDVVETYFKDPNMVIVK